MQEDQVLSEQVIAPTFLTVCKSIDPFEEFRCLAGDWIVVKLDKNPLRNVFVVEKRKKP